MYHSGIILIFNNKEKRMIQNRDRGSIRSAAARRWGGDRLESIRHRAITKDVVRCAKLAKIITMQRFRQRSYNQRVGCLLGVILGDSKRNLKRRYNKTSADTGSAALLLKK